MDPIKAVFVFVATLFFVISAVYPGGFTGFEPDQFPVPQDNPPVQPAGYAFAIWGLIYVWLTVSAVFGMVKRGTDPVWEPARLPLILSVGPGAAWIGVAQMSPLWASVLLWWMLAMALWALARTPFVDRWWYQAPLAVYAGWLTAASWVSVGLLGAGYGLVFGEVIWALIALAGALVTGALVLLWLDRAPEYGAALLWALVGVVVANLLAVPVVSIAAIAGILLIGLMTVRAAT
ncbi:membrane protein, putative [Rhodovulum sp. P5]|uniref:hypothetical protein n=1 Tax=Rhodovulum sp. P5 TaxID=1564506 RepID=UPI0009C1FE46|nr:hypothetical protein [Rhodovulum sp. P5]ARE38504.1 membrane protein, putative [Rhodovulum sp. P5]